MNRLYKNKNKFGWIRDNFTFKLRISYDKYQLAGLSPDTYLKNVFVMLTGQAQIIFYANCEFFILFKDFC